MLSIIVAIANNNVIGRDNKLIWHIPEDLKRFKTITTGKTMIMGKNTFESLPGILPNRKHIIITRDLNYKIDNPMVSVIYSLEDLKPYIEDTIEHFVIGGGQIYKLLLPYTQKMYITEVKEDFKGDTFFPEFDKEQWTLVEELEGITNKPNTIPHKFLTYIRKS